ncbi:MAG: hypothetical protein EOP87_12935, partial [Verrucomicrobiaceae bacterium]
MKYKIFPNQEGSAVKYGKFRDRNYSCFSAHDPQDRFELCESAAAITRGLLDVAAGRFSTLETFDLKMRTKFGVIQDTRTTGYDS